ncbi:MAG TPA: class I SAM-dependent methyltransferase [Nocardioides sp.]
MTTTHELPGLAEAKQHARATWAAGDFPEVARLTLWPVGERLVRRVGIGRDEDVLDIACGTGNAALRAAKAGGRTTGLDLTPELFAAGRTLAREAGVAIDWVEGDAEELPFADESYDVVLSTFGVMFAPRHRIAAREIARVLRPGGRLGLCNWTPGGITGQMFRALGSFAPPAPPFAEPPLLWGDEAHVRELFEGTGIVLEFATETVPIVPFPTAEEAVDWNAAKFGPMIMLRGYLEPQGRWGACRQRLIELYDPDAEGEYLVVTGRKSA